MFNVIIIFIYQGDGKIIKTFKKVKTLADTIKSC